MARVAPTSSRRKIWIPIILILGFTCYYGRHHNDPQYRPPRWNVIDFQIKDYNSQEELYSDTSASFLDQNRIHRPAHDPYSHHDHHAHRKFQAEIEEIGNQKAFQQQQLIYDELQDKIQQFIAWDRPATDHWPAWHDYDKADYDPNRWEALDRYCDHLCFILLFY